MTVLSGVRVVAGDRLIEHGFVRIEGDVIAEVGEAEPGAAPSPQTVPALSRCAASMAHTTALKSAAARISGRLSTNAPTVPDARAGRANASARTLLARDFKG